MTRDSLPETLLQAVKYFGKPENCLSYLVARRWPNGVACPECGSLKVHFDKTRMGWRCVEKHPKRRFTLKTGTIFEDSPLGLDKWLPVVWMIANMKNGVSSWEIHRAIGVTQKTAWFMLHRIRLAMQGDDGGKLGGNVEADETFIGGKARLMNRKRHKKALAEFVAHGPTAMGKIAVMGLLERHPEHGDSQVRTFTLEGRDTTELMHHVVRHVAKGSTVNTDEHRGYGPLIASYQHKVINHAEKYVDGQVHTNGIENYWSLLKRMLRGTYVSVEPFHLFRYLDEQAFRFNTRKHLTDADRFSKAIAGIVGRRVMYKDLIAAPDERRTP